MKEKKGHSEYKHTHTHTQKKIRTKHVERQQNRGTNVIDHKCNGKIKTLILINYSERKNRGKIETNVYINTHMYPVNRQQKRKAAKVTTAAAVIVKGMAK